MAHNQTVYCHVWQHYADNKRSARRAIAYFRIFVLTSSRLFCRVLHYLARLAADNAMVRSVSRSSVVFLMFCHRKIRLFVEVGGDL